MKKNGWEWDSYDTPDGPGFVLEREDHWCRWIEILYADDSILISIYDADNGVTSRQINDPSPRMVHYLTTPRE